MKSYGKVDETWDDSKFQTIIEDAIRLAAEQKNIFVVGQDMDGTAVVALSGEYYSPILACVATVFDDDELQDGEIYLENNVKYRKYSMDEMVPRVRDVLTKGIVEYGDLQFPSEDMTILRATIYCADSLVQLYKCPFIVGLTVKGMVVAPLSERDKFFDVASCVVTKNGYWSVSDKLPENDYMDKRVPLTDDETARYSVKIRNPVDHVYRGVLYSCMKSYGKVDETWDDAKFQTIIKDAICMAREQKKPFAVGQDADGIVVVALSQEGYPPIFACVVTAFDDEEFQEGKIVLVDNVVYLDYSVDDMVPRVRDVLTKGIVEYGRLRFLSEGMVQLGEAMSCADDLVQLYKSPFIVGLTVKGMVVAPLSERDKFFDVASCVVTKNGCWSMSDKLPKGGCHYMNRHVRLATNGTACCSVMINSPVDHVYCGILESKRRH